MKQPEVSITSDEVEFTIQISSATVLVENSSLIITKPFSIRTKFYPAYITLAYRHGSIHYFFYEQPNYASDETVIFPSKDVENSLFYQGLQPGVLILHKKISGSILQLPDLPSTIYLQIFMNGVKLRHGVDFTFNTKTRTIKFTRDVNGNELTLVIFKNCV